MSSPSSSHARRSLALLIVINLFCYLDRYILTAVLPHIKEEFLKDVPNANGKAGLLGTAFIVSYMLVAPLFGLLADRMSRWIIIGTSVALWTLACGASGLAGSFVALLLTRIFLGVGEGGYGPAAPTLISDLYPVEKRGRVLSWFYVAIPVGSAIGYLWGGFIATRLTWHWAFYLIVPPGLILAFLCFLMRDPRLGADAPARGKKKASLQDYKRLARIPSLITNIAAQTALTFSIGGLSFWMPTYLKEARGLELDHATFVFGLITVTGGLISTLLGGIIADRLRDRIPGSYFLVSGCGMLLGFPAIVALIYAPMPWAWVFVFLAIFFLFLNTGPSNTALANVTPARIRATAFALNILIIHALGDAISPPIIGLIRDYSNWNVALLTVSSVTLVAGVIWIFSMKSLARDTAIITLEESTATQPEPSLPT